MNRELIREISYPFTVFFTYKLFIIPFIGWFNETWEEYFNGRRKDL